MDQWLWIGGALVLGVVVGAVVTALTMGRRRGDEESVRRLRREFEGYRHEVTEHFVETAELVNNLTHSYKAVYDHLERGAYRLVGEETLHRELENIKAEPVMLEYIGQRRTPLPPRPQPAPSAAAPASATGADHVAPDPVPEAPEGSSHDAPHDVGEPDDGEHDAGGVEVEREGEPVTRPL